VSPDAVFEAMRALVADRLARKPGDVMLDSRLVDDLGADSLDFVDLVFAIEKRFGVKLRDDELDVLSQLDFSSPEVMRDGFLTPAVVERLMPALPALRDVADPARVTPAAVFGLITVDMLCAMVTRKQAAGRT
jgi:acyl carrier protein